MTSYRSLETIKAVQYQGEPIPDVTCQGSNEEFLSNGCDSSRRNVPHVHTMAVGGMTCLQKGDWIFPLHGGPFGVASDAKFRSHWEVPEVIPPAVATTDEHYFYQRTTSINDPSEQPEPEPLEPKQSEPEPEHPAPAE